MSDQLSFDAMPEIRVGFITDTHTPLSTKQRAILEYLRVNKSITVSQAAALVGKNLYFNENKHTGVTLARMVDRGLIVRRQRGVFTLS